MDIFLLKMFSIFGKYTLLAFLCRKVFYLINQDSPESPRGTVAEDSVPARHSCRFPFCTSLLINAHTGRQSEDAMHEEHNKTQNEDLDVDVSDEVLLDIEEDDDVITEDPLETKLDDECEKSKDFFDQLQRLQAEFENYRKRMDNRISDARKFASEEILLKFLDIYDNLLRALDMDFETDPVSAKQGIEAITQQFEKILLTEDVRPIESIGKVFDPYYQHAVNRVSDLDKPDGLILEEYQRGYMLKEKVLRPSVVLVNHHEIHSAQENDDNESEKKSEENGE